MASSDALPVVKGGMTTPTTWNKQELLHAQRNKAVLATIYPGLTGTIEEIRENDVVVKASGWGATAYLRLDSINTLPHFNPEARVTTPFGRGTVIERRVSDERIDYVVSLVDCKLANNQPAIGYFAPSAIDHRFDLTFDEMIADCTLFRNIGNEMFKLKDFSSALTNYKKCVDVLGHVPAGLTLPQRELLRDGVVKALSNTAQCYLSQPEPDYAAAKHMASEGLLIDRDNSTGQRDKLLYRRACASIGQQDWQAAIEDLRDPSLVSNSTAQSKLKEAKAALSKEKEQNKKMWGGAFAKAAEAPESPTANGVGAANGDAAASTSSPARIAASRPMSVASPATPGLAHTGDSSSPARPAAASRRSIKEIKAEAAASGASAADVADVASGLSGAGADAGGGDATLEKELEGVEEDTNWGKYALYGGLAVGALALGAYALSKVRR